MDALNGHLDAGSLIRSSFALVVLLVCSAIVLAIALERFWRYHRARADVGALRAGLTRAMRSGSAEDALAVCRAHPSPAAAVAEAGLANRHLALHELDEVMAAAAAGERLSLEKRLWILATAGTLTPFIGLFGTVVGIMKAFQDLAAAGGGGPSVVAAGIAEALVTTAAGLAVAIPAVAIHNGLARRVRAFTTEMEIMAAYLVAMLASEGGAEMAVAAASRNGRRSAEKPGRPAHSSARTDDAAPWAA